MTRLITIFIIVVALYGGYHLFSYWEQIKNEEETTKHEAAAVAEVQPENLPGLPPQLAQSFQAAQRQGPDVLRNWLKTYGKMVQDPRKAWIELDYCAAIVREDPAEARRVFAQVKERTPPSSPVWPRVQQLQKTYE
jgi:hypothetical protein